MTAPIELDWLKRWNAYAPHGVALKDGETGRTLTYRQFFELANAGAHVLQERFGVGRGDRVAVLANNELEYIALFFAVQRLGAVLVPINFRSTLREVEHVVSDCTPKVIISQDAYSDLVSKLSGPRLAKWAWHGPEGVVASLDAARASDEVPFVGGFEDPVMILYTSGTTGAPKGALLSHRMLFWNSVNTTLRLNISQNDCAVVFLPLFHTGAWNVLTTPFLHRGAKIVLVKKFDADQVLKLSDSERATLLFGVPTTMGLMARSPLFDTANLKSVRYAIVGGEPMPLPSIEKWHARGVLIRQGYGLTEFGPNVFSLNEEDATRKIGSIGFPNFYIDAKVIDETGQALGPNEVGELALRGPMCMTGYWQNEKATRETIVDGWLLTGDLVRRDAEGYFYVVGRKKDMFKSGGENVYPPELEQVLAKLPGVREVAVIGVPDAQWGEVGKAFIVRESESVTVDTVRAHCLQNLAKFKVPKHVAFVDALPKGDSGKVLKRKLAELEKAQA